MHVRVNAQVDGTLDGLFLYTVGDRLGGIEWVGSSEHDDPVQLPDPAILIISPPPAERPHLAADGACCS